jgi:hypothetical protein
MALSLKSLSEKHIPTIVGLILLVAGLIGGVFLVSQSNTNSFLPRASPQTTPKNLKITNVTDTTFTVSWQTDGQTPGYVRYGTNPTALSTTITDDRDQSSGTAGVFLNHHVTVRNLTANTAYSFKVGTGTSELYDDNGTPYGVKTVSPVTAEAKTLYGNVSLPSGAAAAGALVYLTSDTIAPMSTLVQSSGSWVLTLSQARTKDLTQAATLDASTVLSLLVVSPQDQSTSLVTVPLSQAQPVAQVTLGQNLDLTASATPQPSTAATTSATPVPTEVQNKFTSQLLGPATQVTGSTLTITNPAMDNDLITVNNPQLQGAAPAGNKVKLTVKGKITQTTTITVDPSGVWVWTPPTTLTNTTYALTASTTISGQAQTVTRAFVVDTTQASTTPSLTASESASAAPIATPIPTIAATATPISTSSAFVSNPATTAGRLVSGSTEATSALLILGSLFLALGGFAWVLL